MRQRKHLDNKQRIQARNNQEQKQTPDGITGKDHLVFFE